MYTCLYAFLHVFHLFRIHFNSFSCIVLRVYVHRLCIYFYRWCVNFNVFWFRINFNDKGHVIMGPGPGTRAPSCDGETFTKNTNIIIIIYVFSLVFVISKKTLAEISCRSALELRRYLCSETDWWQKGWIHKVKLTSIFRLTPLISKWVLSSLVAITIMDVPVSYWIAIPAQGAGISPYNAIHYIIPYIIPYRIPYWIPYIIPYIIPYRFPPHLVWE